MHDDCGNERLSRLRELRAALVRRGSSVAALARLADVSCGHMRRVLMGERRASIRVVTAVRRLLGDEGVALLESGAKHGYGTVSGEGEV